MEDQKKIQSAPAPQLQTQPPIQPWIAQLNVSQRKIRLAILLLALLWLVIVGASWAQDAEAADAPPPQSSDDEYSFNWLDPEKKIYVLQNRRYTKAGHALLSLMVGPGLSNPYRTTFNIDPRLAFYFSEAWGIEAFFTYTGNTANNTVKALNTATGTAVAVVREIQTQAGALLHWAPWYAKINVFNKILYFDWYFSAGGGMLHTLSGDTSPNSTGTALDLGAVFVGTGHQFHLSEALTFRLDFTGAFYNAPVVGNSGDSAWYSNYNFGVGLGLRL